MIPKIIHYCWFGGNPKPKLAKKCIKSWKKFCSNYKIIEWNESNYDISKAPLYVRQAYQKKQWAFVTDYVRLEVVYENGGIYVDTDVEVIKSLDNLLKYDAYFCVEEGETIATGLGFGAIKNFIILKELMDQYNNICFINNDGSYDRTTCPDRNKKVFEKYNMVLENNITKQVGNTIIFSTEYACPSYINPEKHKTKNTFSIHHFAASWYSNDERKRKVKTIKRIKRARRHSVMVKRLRSILIFFIGVSNYQKLKKFFSKNS